MEQHFRDTSPSRFCLHCCVCLRKAFAASPLSEKTDGKRMFVHVFETLFALLSWLALSNLFSPALFSDKTFSIC